MNLTRVQAEALQALPTDHFITASELAEILDRNQRSVRSTLLQLNGKGLVARDLQRGTWARLTSGPGDSVPNRTP